MATVLIVLLAWYRARWTRSGEAKMAGGVAAIFNAALITGLTPRALVQIVFMSSQRIQRASSLPPSAAVETTFGFCAAFAAAGVHIPLTALLFPSWTLAETQMARGHTAVRAITSSIAALVHIVVLPAQLIGVTRSFPRSTGNQAAIVFRTTRFIRALVHIPLTAFLLAHGTLAGKT